MSKLVGGWVGLGWVGLGGWCGLSACPSVEEEQCLKSHSSSHPPTQQAPSNTLVMCNHLSNADAYFLCSALLPWETKYIAKADLFKVSYPPTHPPTSVSHPPGKEVKSPIYPIKASSISTHKPIFNPKKQVPFGGWAMARAGDLPVHFTRNAQTGWGVKKGTVRLLLLFIHSFIHSFIRSFIRSFIIHSFILPSIH